MWHFACTPFIFSRSANSCVWFRETNTVFLALLVLSVVFNKALERSDVAPYQGSHFFLRRQHSGAHIAHESFKMLTMWIISWIKVTDHVRSGKLRATVFTVIIRGIRKKQTFTINIYEEEFSVSREIQLLKWPHRFVQRLLIIPNMWSIFEVTAEHTCTSCCCQAEVKCIVGQLAVSSPHALSRDPDLIKWAGQVDIKAFGASPVVCNSSNSSWAATCCWS